MALVEIKVPAIAESVTEVTLSQWLKPNGSIVKLDEPICEFESDKATLELPAEVAGKLVHVAAEGSDLKIGDVVAKIDTSVGADSAPAAPVSTPSEPIAKAEPAAASANYATGTPSPAAAKILVEGNVAAADVQGTGRDGRITKDDAAKAVENKAVGNKTVAPVAKPAEAPKSAPTPSVSAAVLGNFSRNQRREKMSRMRQTIAKRLVSAKNNTAMLTTFNEIDMSGVMALREKYQERFVKKYGVKLGFMSIFGKACAKVLLEMPDVNAMIDGTDFIYNDFVDISMAISTPTGLVVPPIKNVESLNFAQFELALKALADKARSGKLTLEEMQGGTFTITNGGVFGSLMSTPIINEPQSAILGLHAIKERPIVVDGQIVVRPMMYVALSYDHRVIDGSTSVTFLVKVKELIEDPTTLLLDI
ncbi:MAG: 2-oxoglutarate dehydrogenase complex dihydrolipoyllysine-residue succinyltransferase [Saprospiraceae bacterium]|nr:2-oxoglutarate dehydrogenase complex dihydrolipoyllysine-residue succinyltransferase [Saprospiraceae bacterium]